MDVSSVLNLIADDSLKNYIPVLKKIFEKPVDFKELKDNSNKLQINDFLEFAFQKQGSICLQDCRELFHPMNINDW